MAVSWVFRKQAGNTGLAFDPQVSVQGPACVHVFTDSPLNFHAKRAKVASSYFVQDGKSTMICKRSTKLPISFFFFYKKIKLFIIYIKFKI